MLQDIMRNIVRDPFRAFGGGDDIVGGGGGGGFDPAIAFTSGKKGVQWDVDPAYLYSDAGMTTLATLNGAVLRIADKSGNANHGTVANATLRQDSNGKYYLEANGSNSQITRAAMTFTADMDLFFSGQVNIETSAGSGDFVSAYNGAGDGKLLGFVDATSAASLSSGTPSHYVDGAVAVNTGLRANFGTGEPHVLEVRNANMTVGGWTILGIGAWSGTLALAGRFYGAILVEAQPLLRADLLAYVSTRNGRLIPKPVSGIAIGDSTIAAYLGQNEVMFYVPTSLNKHTQAVPNDTIQGQARDFGLSSYALTARWAVVQVGLNNLNPAEATATTIARLQTLVTNARARLPASSKLLVSKMTPCRAQLISLYGGVNGPLAYQKWLDMNEAIAGGGATPITGADARITAHEPLLNDGSGNLAAAYASDSIHPNNAGRAIVGQAWTDALNLLGVL